jgi:acetylornithine deacetylase/succinyl-diaminopimelate desuccinylase-like protein
MTAIWEEINWDEALDEALGHFKTLIRFKTVNPPGDEKPAAEYLAEVFRKEGLEPEVLDSADNRANVVCRLRGNGDKAPILLNGHLDVVPVERDKWSCDPFEAIERDGCIYGRGAVDMKNMVTTSAMCLLLLKRFGVPLKRDLIFCAVADEETGGQYGSQFLVDEHPDKVRAEYSISELGGFPLEMFGTRFYLVQVAEKGACWFRIKTSGDPGHGSIPDSNSALIKAARIAATLGAKRLPQHNVEAASRFIRLLSSHLKFPKNIIFKLLLKPTFSSLILDRLIPQKDVARALSAVLHNTANPTVIRAGNKSNVIPSEAILEVDGRILPGFTREDLVKELRALIGEEAEIEVMREMTPTESPAQDPIMDLIAEVIASHDPAGLVAPYLVTGITDATHWKRLGMKCYGFSPLKLPEGASFQSLLHGHDERIPIDGFRFGLKALFELVTKLVT